jgi:hypothetical protein
MNDLFGDNNAEIVQTVQFVSCLNWLGV